MQELLPDTTISHYCIVSKLGAGRLMGVLSGSNQLASNVDDFYRTLLQTEFNEQHARFSPNEK